MGQLDRKQLYHHLFSSCTKLQMVKLLKTYGRSFGPNKIRRLPKSYFCKELADYYIRNEEIPYDNHISEVTENTDQDLIEELFGENARSFAVV